jgi:uncharacterized protein (DUF58 family)
MRPWLLLKILLHPLRWAQERIDQWVLARVKRQPGPIRIERRRIYILPTRFGYGFALMTLVMLLGAMNYSNSMAFALSFLLAALGLVCMHHTHANLLGLQLRAGSAAPVFCGGLAHFEVQLDNPGPHERLSLQISWPHGQVEQVGDAPGGGGTRLRLAAAAPRRGWLRAGVFSVATEFPLGLFHAWTWAELDVACLVYPRPAPPGLMPITAIGSGGETAGGRAGQDEFAGLRSYQRGDALHAIHWKSLPKLQSPMVKQFSDTLSAERWLDWDSLPTLETEARLSQLTRWVLDADAEDAAYGLRLPGTVLPPARGEAHRLACLRALALYGPPA